MQGIDVRGTVQSEYADEMLAQRCVSQDEIRDDASSAARIRCRMRNVSIRTYSDDSSTSPTRAATKKYH